jgi:excisionase family DNA binding protein
MAETAAVLRVSKGWVYKRVEADELPAQRLGSGPKALIRIDRADLRRYLLREERDTECAPQAQSLKGAK